MISFNNALKKYISNSLEENGFNIDKKSSSVIFSKAFNEYENVKQFISFQKSNHMDQAFKVELSTSLKRFDKKQVGDFVGRTDDWWFYHNESSLAVILKEIEGLLINFGFSWLDVKSTPDLKPDMHISKQLIINPHSRLKHFEEEYGYNIEKIADLKIIESFLLVKKNEMDNSIDWEMILNISAFIGEWICYKYEGEWFWNDDYNTPAVKTSKGDSLNVLLRVARFWGKPQLPEYSLNNMYKFLRNKYN